MLSPTFGRSKLLNTKRAREVLPSILLWSSVKSPDDQDHHAPNVVLVGQSVEADTLAFRGSGFGLFDTYQLTSFPRYVNLILEMRCVIGAHNASTDAAYTVMALLLHALKLDQNQGRQVRAFVAGYG